MDLLVSNLGIPAGLAGWKTLQTKKPADFTAFTNDPVLKREIAYFRDKAPKATTPEALLKDPRLEEIALTAFGLTAQIGMQGLMKQVLASDVTDKTSAAARMTDPRYRSIAAAFNYGAKVTAAQAAVASTAAVEIKDPGQAFNSFSGNFGGVSVKDVWLTDAVTPDQIAAKLQAAFRRADGNRSDITVKALGFKLQFSDALGRGTAQDFTFDTGENVPGATAASTTVTLDGLDKGVFQSFAGSFANVALKDVDLTKATTPGQVAAILQSAFQKADGGRTDITVTADGSNLVLTDGRSRGLSHSFTFAAKSEGPTAGASATSLTLKDLNGSLGFDSFSGHFAGVTVENVDLSSASTPAQVASALQAAFHKADNYSSSISVTADGDTLTFKDRQGGGTTDSFIFAAASDGTTAAAPTKLVAGSQAVAQQGGPAVTSKNFIDQVVQLYTQAKFEQVVGDTSSDALRKALYAQRQLPKITNWYSVISDRPLANVIQTAFGLPDTFVKLDVDRQVSMLKSKMDVKDFQNPTKLAALLNKFVSMSMANGTDVPASSTSATSLNPAVMMLGNMTGISASSATSTLSGASLAALLLANTQGN
ncbi:conserved protein of unknown function (plasmid) [Rhodovastum atsumiense]|uniref:DUF1217 domain-containing protein n=1 Tax=Rhodovastum atsumiense TaxID=504468 RepID=UPI002023C557|nr:DUF1217 domain-containing protein [Rhodovastum atsumiense]CAH2605616.1 conserved protein of unknown function [Rhodovastum atsumiense]